MGYEYMKVRGLCVDVSYLVMGPLENNVYILSDGKSAIVVDPCMDAKSLAHSEHPAQRVLALWIRKSQRVM